MPDRKVVALTSKSDNNRTWSPRDAVNDLVDDQRLNTSKQFLAIFYYAADDGRSLRLGMTRAGLTRAEEIALLHMALAECVEEWKS